MTYEQAVARALLNAVTVYNLSVPGIYVMAYSSNTAFNAWERLVAKKEGRNV